MGGVKKNKSSVFRVQILECFLVIVFLNCAALLGGKLIYNNPFPFGFLEGIIAYAIAVALSVMILAVNKYFSFKARPINSAMARILLTILVVNMMYAAILYFNQRIILSPYYFVVVDVLQFPLLLLIKRMSDFLKIESMRKRITIVIGKNLKGNPIVLQLMQQGVENLKFVSVEDEKIKQYIEEADDIYLSVSISKKGKDRILSHAVLKGKSIFIVPETYEIAIRKSEITQIGDIPVFSIEDFQLTEPQLIVKRTVDIILSILGIICTSPLMIFAAIRIKAEDGGPILFKQVRTGRHGKDFEVFKFRSMIHEAEKLTGAVFAKEHDARITKIGRLMRATRIDEIPQFFNVLGGSMSLIGPRPERPVFVEQFIEEIPEYSSRLMVKPGITGLAQVMGNYTTTADNKLKFDLIYIRDYSIFLDLKIIVKTVGVVFKKEQAEGFSKERTIEMETLPLNDMISVNEYKKKGSRAYQIGKIAIALMCCLVIVFGSMTLRYSALAMTMLRAAAPVNNTATLEQDIVTASLDGAAIPQNNPSQSVLVSPSGITTPTTGAQTVSPDAIVVSTSSVKAIYTEEELLAATSSFTFLEKSNIVIKFISKMSTENLMRLEDLSRDGFTLKEKEEAKAMMYMYFDSEEVAYIKDVYHKVMD